MLPPQPSSLFLLPSSSLLLSSFSLPSCPLFSLLSSFFLLLSLLLVLDDFPVKSYLSLLLKPLNPFNSLKNLFISVETKK